MKLLPVTLLLLWGIAPIVAQYNASIQLQPILKTDTTSIGQNIQFPAAGNNEVTMVKVTLPPGQSTGWHLHHIPVFAYVMKGTLTVQTKDGRTLVFPENSAFAEMKETPHNGTNRDSVDCVLMAVYLGQKGVALSEKLEGMNKE